MKNKLNFTIMGFFMMLLGSFDLLASPQDDKLDEVQLVFTRRSVELTLTPELIKAFKTPLQAIKNATSTLEEGTVITPDILQSSTQSNLNKFPFGELNYSILSCVFYSSMPNRENWSAYDYLLDYCQRRSAKPTKFIHLLDKRQIPYHLLELKREETTQKTTVIKTYLMLQVQAVSLYKP